MKNILPFTLLLLIFINLNLNAQTYVPDNNFEQALIDLGYDTVLDDYVDTSSINSVTQLNVSNKNIQDLTGIEDFNALTILNCANNPNLNALNIANNTALLQLHTSYTSISSLDISNLILLQQLSCNGNSNLTNLDISNNTDLGILFINETNISAIDVSTNTALNYLDCNTTNLTSLNLSTNIALTRLYCQNTNIGSLDLSANTSLDQLYCADNPNLSNLNIKNGNNTNVTLFNATNNPNLTCIEVDDEDYSNTNWPNKDIGAMYSNDCTNLGIVDVERFSLEIYPNPVNNILFIKSKNSIDRIEILNFQGKKVTVINSDKINMSSLSSGIYILKIKSGNTETFKKIIKK
ncbi:T9SS type A sorting domain-containing protein [Winogradskyella sp. R77965]|uniref:T9SS type A sorting domain-containing protein n=1 Tax=Winogradskyella sp. R77965 TaxID=3093872 RepID=UPI0037DBF343